MFNSIGTYPNIIVFLISKLLKCKTICISHDYMENKLQIYTHQKLFSTVIAPPYAYFKNQKKLNLLNLGLQKNSN